MIFQLTYRSKAVETINSKDLDNILQTARAVNSSLNITGCLVFFNNLFFQLLEGDQNSVTSLFSAIKTDHRHTNVELLVQEPTEDRLFPNWGMAYYPVNDKEVGKPEFEQFKRNLILLSDFSEAKTITEIRFWNEVKKKVLGF
ncbi:MAG: BLUF domain-containing protein [Flavobacteriaceae bacterium]|nr:BLUF domain-containing protein [Flavobacteriaceae bacterium]